jgi:hypothetical protein
VDPEILRFPADINISLPEENLLEYFDYESELNKLAEKLVNFTPVKDKYLNREAMKDDIYNLLKDFMFGGDFDWDDMANNPYFSEDLHYSDFYYLQKIFMLI